LAIDVVQVLVVIGRPGGVDVVLREPGGLNTVWKGDIAIGVRWALMATVICEATKTKVRSATVEAGCRA